jgi:hypothetical protein
MRWIDIITKIVERRTSSGVFCVYPQIYLGLADVAPLPPKPRQAFPVCRSSILFCLGNILSGGCFKSRNTASFPQNRESSANR